MQCITGLIILCLYERHADDDANFFVLSRLIARLQVYVRMSDWDKIMCEVTKDDIAERLRNRLEVRGEEWPPP